MCEVCGSEYVKHWLERHHNRCTRRTESAHEAARQTLALNLPNMNNFSDFFISIGLRGNDQQTVQQIDRNTVRRLVVSAANGCDAAVGGQDENGGKFAL